jgi:hypothetical protein
MGRARRAGLAAALMVAAAGLQTAPVSAVPAAPAATTQAAGCDPAGGNELQLLLPAWGDQAGWANPNQYEDILTADLDGDGTDELIGRNGGGFEIWSWGQPFQATASAFPNDDPPPVVTGLPAPGHWVPSSIPGLPESDLSGFWDPSTYSTVRAVSLGGGAFDQLVWRSPDGLIVADYSTGSWSVLEYPSGVTGPMGNSYNQPWWEETYYSTITSGDVDGNGTNEIVGRGPNGVQSWSYSAGNWTRVDQDGVMADPDWEGLSYSDSLRVGDVTGDNAADLIGRTDAGGLVVWSLVGGTWQQQGVPQGAWTDNGGTTNTWNDPSWYTTIGLADLNGDGTDDIYGRTQYGIDAWSFAGETWTHLTATPTAGAPSILSNTQGFEQPQYYETIQTSHLGPATPSSPDLVLARTAAGVGFYQLSGGSFGAPLMAQTQFSDANGWASSAARYGTITTVPIAAGLVLLMGKDNTGMQNFQLSGGSPNGTWVSPSAPFPAWSDDGASSSAPPPGYDPTLWSQQVSAYSYINQQWVLNGGGTGASQNIRSAMISPTALMSTPYDLAGPLTWLKDLDPPTGQNIPQDVWDQVWWQTWGWLYQAGNLQNFLFADTASMQQLLTQGGIYADGVSPTDVASAYFDGSQQTIDAIVLDLLGNIIETAGYATDTGAGTAVASIISLTGAGVGTADALSGDPDTVVNTTAENLDSELASYFCAAQSFLLTAYGNAANDAGLLGAMGQMTIEGPLLFQYPAGAPSPPSSISFGAVLNAYTNQQSLWTWQQLAAGTSSDGSGGWRVGYCVDQKGKPNKVENAPCQDGFRSRVADGYGTAYEMNDVCEYGIGDICTYGTQYRVVNTSCKGSDTKGDDAWKALDQLNIGFNPESLFMPREQLDQYYANWDTPSAYQSPVPTGSAGRPAANGRMGIMGWRVLPEDCS